MWLCCECDKECDTHIQTDDKTWWKLIYVGKNCSNHNDNFMSATFVMALVGLFHSCWHYGVWFRVWILLIIFVDSLSLLGSICFCCCLKSFMWLVARCELFVCLGTGVMEPWYASIIRIVIDACGNDIRFSCALSNPPELINAEADFSQP